MADLPVNVPAIALAERLAHSIDLEGKIPRALDSLGPIRGSDVVLIDADRGLRARQLASLGGRIVAVERSGRIAALREGLDSAAAGPDAVLPVEPLAVEPLAVEPLAVEPIRIAEGAPDRLPLPDASVDTVVGCWSVFRGPPEVELAEADRVLRPGGRLLAVHDYGRDDVSALRGADRPEYGEWSRRDGTFLRRGFRIRVIHCFWTFDSIDAAREILADAFGPAGEHIAAGLRRPRLSYNVAVYHRTKGDAETSPAA